MAVSGLKKTWQLPEDDDGEEFDEFFSCTESVWNLYVLVESVRLQILLHLKVLKLSKLQK